MATEPTITCPHGHGETDFSACCEGYRQRRAGCATCPGPIYLAASSRSDAFNAALADRLKPLLQGTPVASSMETPPEKRQEGRPRPIPAAVNTTGLARPHGPISRYKALALAISHAMEKRPQAERIGLLALLRHYQLIPRAMPIKDEMQLRSVIRAAGLPRMILPNNSRALPINDHVRAFVRSYKPKKAAA